MSLDFYLCYEYCEHCRRGSSDVFSRNITHNVSKIWDKAGVWDALYNSQGKRASEIIEVLRSGENKIEREFSEYKKLDSPNGWGKAENALDFLHEVRRNCELNPAAFIVVSK